MPKTANKRAEARKMARVQRAHAHLPERPINRRVPLAQRRAKPRTVMSVIQDFPVASGIFALLLVGLVVLVMYNQGLGPFAKPAPPTQAVCDVKKHTCNKAPLLTINKDYYYAATIKTAKGDIVLSLDASTMPIAVNNFVFLARQSFYNGLDFSRVERLGQVSSETNQPSNLGLIQAGEGGKKGGPGYTVKFEANTGSYAAGAIAWANESQFFITTADDSQAIPSGKYPVFGRVTAGLEVAKRITLHDKIVQVSISESKTAPNGTPTAETDTATISMAEANFEGNATVTIKAGQTVTFVSGGTHKLVIGSDGQFKAQKDAPAELNNASGLAFGLGDTKVITFATPGVYHITCLLHPNMAATVTVTK